MQTTRITELSSDRIAALSRERGEPASLLARREAAWARFESTPFAVPRGSTLSRSRLKNLNLTGLAAAAAAAPAPATERGGAGEGVQVLDWSEGLKLPRVQELLFSTRLPEDGKLELLQEAMPAYGTIVYVPRGATLTEPVTLETTVTPQGAILHTLIVTEANAQVAVIERVQTRAGATGQGLVSHRVEIFPGEGATVTYASIQDLAMDAVYLATKRAAHAKDSKVVWVDTQLGSAVAKSEVTSLLSASGASCQNFGAFLGTGKQEYDLSARGRQTAPHTDNYIFTKGVLRDEARSIFFGHVDIQEQAANASGHQKSATLMLTERAHADAIPVLDVENNNVSASHGATVGQVDPEQLFYLRSRGFSELAAKRLIVEGFFEPLFREIPLERVRDELQANIVRRVA